MQKISLIFWFLRKYCFNFTEIKFLDMIKKILLLLICLSCNTNKQICKVEIPNLGALETVYRKVELIEPQIDELELILLALKSQEGIRLKAYFDTDHYSIGWGTKAKKGDTTDIGSANIEMLKAYNKRLKWVISKFPNADNWTALVLAMMRYNVSNFGETLKEAILSKDKTRIAAAMRLYIKDNKGNKLKGLVRRRELEAKLLTSTPKEKKVLFDSLTNVVNRKIKIALK